MSDYFAPYLPVEIIEEILGYLDGKSLCCASKVCSTWNSIVQKLQTSRSLWRDICKHEMSLDEVNDVICQLYPASRLRQVWSDQNINWFTVFKTNHSMKLVGKINCQPQEIQNFNQYKKQQVNCVQITGGCVLTGHDDGTVLAWSLEGHYLELLATHLRPVTDIALISYFSEVACSHWHIQHEYVISTSGDHTIQINPICPASMAENCKKIILQVHACPTMLVRSHNDDFIVISEDAGVSIWSTEPPTQPFEQPKVTLVTFTINYTWQRLLSANFCAGRLPGEAISMTANCMTLSGRHLKVDVCMGEDEASNNANLYWTLQLGKEPVVSDPPHDLVSSHTICDCAIWRDQLFVIVTDSHTLCLSTDGEVYREYHTVPNLQGYPTSVMLVKNLLILGLDTGEVVVYYFTEASELLQLDTLEVHLRLQLGQESIHHLAMSVREDITTLVAASLRHMYLVKLI